MHFLYSRPELIRGRKVLELGAGSGLLSIFCGAVLDADIVIATDGSPHILKALEKNVDLNAEFWDDGRRGPISRQLDFVDDLPSTIKNDLTDDGGLQVIPDIIIGADLVYDRDLAKHLGQNLQAAARDVHAMDIIIATTERITDTFKTFEDEFNMGEYLNFTIPEFHAQKGLFHMLATGIRIYGVLRGKP